MSTLPLNDIVDIILNVSPISAIRASFSLGLIIGKSTVISAVNRVKEYTSLAAMVTDGFLTSSAEYKAASLYFSQKPTPKKVLIGRWDGTGSETAVEAVTACRDKNSEWYAFTVCDATKQQILDLAAWTESAVPTTVHFFSTKDADVPTGTAGNVFLTLKGLLRKRTIGMYSTDNDYAIASIMAYAMSANTQTAGSAYTLAFKQLPGVLPEVLDSFKLNSILNANGNTYVNQGVYYNVFRQGKMADGSHFDELLGLDILTNDIQLSVMDVLTSVPKVPQTDSGLSLVTTPIVNACTKAVTSGFVAPGEWNGPQILNLAPGDTLSEGYLIQAGLVSEQSQADRDARLAPPIYVAVKLAGAVEAVVITVNVNR